MMDTWIQVAANGVFITLMLAVFFSDVFWKSGKFQRPRNVIVRTCAYLNGLFILLLVIVIFAASKTTQ